MTEIQPINRAGRPEGVANMVWFLASDRVEWITGTALKENGDYRPTAGSLSR